MKVSLKSVSPASHSSRYYRRYYGLVASSSPAHYSVQSRRRLSRLVHILSPSSSIRATNEDVLWRYLTRRHSGAASITRVVSSAEVYNGTSLRVHLCESMILGVERFPALEFRRGYEISYRQRRVYKLIPSQRSERDGR